MKELPHSIQSPVEGQVSFADLRLGRQVEAGDVLVRLDVRHLELEVSEAEATLATLDGALLSLKEQMLAEERARAATEDVVAKSTNASEARVSVDTSTLAFRQRESEMMAKLREISAVSALDGLKSAEGAEHQRGELRVASAQAALDTSNGRLSIKERDNRIAAARVGIAQAEVEKVKITARLATLRFDIDRRTLRAPVAGVLGEVQPVTLGMTLASQQTLATLLPRSELRLVAYFAPEESLGLLRPGQTAEMRIQNFPWTQYGTVSAQVSQVAAEAKDGRIRVELALVSSNPRIPLQHGLSGACDVRVGETSPLGLLLRASGFAKAPSTQAPAPSSREPS